MALAITAVLVGATEPRPVQVNITDLTIGQPYTVSASSGSWSRVVQGGEGVADSTQLLLIDIATPLNSAITYTVVHTSTVATLGTVTVLYGDRDHVAVLQSLDGVTVAGWSRQANDDPVAQGTRNAFYAVAGRERPIMHYDVSSSESGTLLVRTSGSDTVALRELIRQGAPVLLRTEVGRRDFDPVDVLGIRSAPRSLVGPVGDLRQWALAYTLVDDNDTTPLVMVTLADWNTYFATKFLSDFNAQFAGQTLANVNAFLGAL